MKTSKVKQIIPQADKDWNGKVLKKDLIIFENEENGTLTTFPDNTQPVIGDELSYEIIDNGFGAEVKLEKKGGKGGGFNKAWTPDQVAQQDAVKITCAAMSSGLDLKTWKQFFVECKDFMLHQTSEAKTEEKLPFD